jgi:hypothetical protein
MNRYPLDIAVQSIIAGSHLQNDSLSYYHISTLSTLNPDKVTFPIVTSVNNVYGFTSTKAYTTLRVSVIFQKPDIQVCEDRLIYQNQLINYAESYKKDLIEIAYWLTGKLRLAGNKKIIEDIYFAENTTNDIVTYFGGELKDEDGNIILSEDIVIVEAILRLEGYPEDICTPVFNPDSIC